MPKRSFLTKKHVSRDIRLEFDHIAMIRWQEYQINPKIYVRIPGVIMHYILNSLRQSDAYMRQ